MLAVWGDPLALGPSVPTAPVLPTPNPPLPTFGLLSPPVQGEPRLPPQGKRVGGGGVATRTLSPPWGPWLLLLTAPAAPSLQPDEADGPALGLERLFVSPPPLFHGSRDQLESTSPPWGPDTGME